MSTEIGSVLTVLPNVRVGVKEEIGSEGEELKGEEGDEEDVAELEKEVCSSRVHGCVTRFARAVLWLGLGGQGFDVSALSGVSRLSSFEQLWREPWRLVMSIERLKHQLARCHVL